MVVDHHHPYRGPLLATRLAHTNKLRSAPHSRDLAVVLLEIAGHVAFIEVNNCKIAGRG
jgi:hypothetical protein